MIPGQFLIKDLALLGISLWSLGEAWKASEGLMDCEDHKRQPCWSEQESTLTEVQYKGLAMRRFPACARIGVGGGRDATTPAWRGIDPGSCGWRNPHRTVVATMLTSLPPEPGTSEALQGRAADGVEDYVHIPGEVRTGRAFSRPGSCKLQCANHTKIKFWKKS